MSIPRRRWFLGAILTALVLSVTTSAPVSAQDAAQTRVLLVTKGHGFDRAPFFALFDALGSGITWTHVEQPAAQVFWDPEYAADYDVFVYYDAMGRRAMTAEDGSPYFEVPSPEAQANLEALLKQGKGMVFFHHALAAWNQGWPEYQEIMGGACDWGNRVTARGVEYPSSGARGGVTQRITVQDASHPIMAGVPEEFEIVDETYMCPYFEDSVHPLLRTDFDPIPENFPRRYNRDAEWLAQTNFRNHPRASNLTGWVKAAENSPIVYLQHGHNARAWENEIFRTLLRNAIHWAASEEAHAWARSHPQTIF